MSDAIYTLKYLYVPGSPPPPEPGPIDCGLDPSGDELDCGSHPCAGGPAISKEQQYGGRIALGQPAGANEIFSVPVYVENELPLSAFAYTITYDPEALELLSIDYPHASHDFDFSSARNLDEGRIAFGSVVSLQLAASLPPGRHHVANISFATTGGDEVAILDLEDVELVDEEARVLGSSSQGSTIGLGSLKPTRFLMTQNYPNPLREWTTIGYQLPKAARTTVKVYNLTGQVVRTLVDGLQAPGRYSVTWNRTDDFDNRVSAGIYFVRLDADEKSSTRKLAVIE
jgi:hypothetical protein